MGGFLRSNSLRTLHASRPNVPGHGAAPPTQKKAQIGPGEKKEEKNGLAPFARRAKILRFWVVTRSRIGEESLPMHTIPELQSSPGPPAKKSGEATVGDVSPAQREWRPSGYRTLHQFDDHSK
eukprot:COSAG04_NODE_456_length_14055_cov_41.823660_10_plen_123_part_00